MIKGRPDTLVYGGIAVMIAAMTLGPIYSADEFSSLRHSTSEQAGQKMPGAWIMRGGFYAFGTAVFLASIVDWRVRPWVRLALVFFGVGLIAAAFWSNASILAGIPSDMREDRYHSIASGVVGTAFAAACAARLFAPEGDRKNWLAWAGLAISVAIPLAMTELPQIRGLLQRSMFLFSFAFIAREFAGSRDAAN